MADIKSLEDLRIIETELHEFKTPCGKVFIKSSFAIVHATECFMCVKLRKPTFAKLVADNRDEIIARNCPTCQGVQPRNGRQNPGIGKSSGICKHTISASWFDKLAAEFIRLSEM